MPALWYSGEIVPVEPENATLRVVPRLLVHTRRQEDPARPARRVRGGIPALLARDEVRAHRSGCWEGGQRSGTSAAALRASRQHRGEPVSLTGAGYAACGRVGSPIVARLGGTYGGGLREPTALGRDVKLLKNTNRCFPLAVASRNFQRSGAPSLDLITRLEPLPRPVNQHGVIRAGLLLSLVMAGLFFSTTTPALARPPVPANVFRAVRAYWKTQAERVKAFDVIACETGNRYNTTARNGQYLGLFQMGSFARARYGHGSSARAQARAAHAYYVDAGWSPWSCA